MKGTKTLLSYILFIIGYQYKPICCLPEPPCEQDHFQCGSKECVPNFWKCDGQEDCEDGSDETQCGTDSSQTDPQTSTCDEDEIRCNNDRCVNAEWKCDGEDDCGDGTDELNCPTLKPVDHPTTIRPKLRACDETTNFLCKNGKCVPKSWTCNKVDDCGDNSDESTTEKPNCVAFEGCLDTHFHCAKSGACIHKVLVCDLGFDCGTYGSNGTLDKSDEENCVDRSCDASEFKCDNNRCISKQWLCDKQNDCGDDSDEKNCLKNTCSSEEFQCVSSRQCISANFKCDGFDDCMDGSDERNCHSQTTTSSQKALNTTNKPFIVVGKRNTTLPTTSSIQTKIYTTASGCRAGQYRCKSESKCLHAAWKCDGEADCAGMDDESAEVCSSHKCEAHHFRCRNQKCILMRNKCDHIDHCGDNSDEKHCETAQVPCTKDTYRCQGSAKCILKSSVCDGKNDCPWDDDESKICNVNECLVNNGNCEHVCIDLPIGHKCECPRGFELESQSKKCVDINECHVFGKCSQACVNYKGYFACQCDEGYVMSPSNNRTCHAEGPKPKLIIANRFDVREMSTDGIHIRSLTAARDAAFVSFHYAAKTLFYADMGQKAIFRVKLDASNNNSEIVVRNVSKPEGMVVDWLGNKLYWSEGTLNQIIVSNLDGSHVKVVVQGLEEHEIKAIEIYPEKGLLFWSTYGTHCEILRSNLDGSNQSVIIGKDHQLNWPTSLSLDRHTNRLYWAEMSAISTVTLDGKGFKRILYGLTRPHGLTVFEDYVYWTDFVEKSINKANKFNGLEKIHYEGNFVLPQDIKVYHPNIQTQVAHPCKHNNGGCSHLCFMTPAAGRVCACPGLMNLDKDNKTCKGDHEGSSSSIETTAKTIATHPSSITVTEKMIPTSFQVTTTAPAPSTLKTNGKVSTTSVLTETKQAERTTAATATTASTTTSPTTTTTTTTTTTATTTMATTTTLKVKITEKPTTTSAKVDTSAPSQTEKAIIPLSSTIAPASSPEPHVVYPDDIEDEVLASTQGSQSFKIAAIVVSLAGFVAIIVLGVVCYRRKRTHFDLSMVYESHRDVVHEKEDDAEMQAKYIVPPKTMKAFENMNYNGKSSIQVPMSGDDNPDMLDDDYTPSDDVCYDDDAPIMQNMV